MDYYRHSETDFDPRFDSSAGSHDPRFDDPYRDQNHFLNPEDFARMRSRPQHEEGERPFLQRVNKWKSKKQRRLEKKKSDLEKKELKNCTFKPRLSTTNVTDETRLKSYQRSYEKAKRNYINQIKKKESDMRKECTFQPNTAKRKKRRATPTRKSIVSNIEQKTGRVRNIERKTGRRRQSAPVIPVTQGNELEGGQFIDRISKPKKKKDGIGDPHCTFKPTINTDYFRKKRRSNFMYLGNNAFDRLSKQSKRKARRSQTPDFRKRKSPNRYFTPSMNARKSRAKKRPNSAAPMRNLNSVSLGYVKKSLFDGSKTVMSQSAMISRRRQKKSSQSLINQFLKRTEERDNIRSQRLEMLRKGHGPKFRPKISQKSKAIMKSGPSFLDRLEVKLQSQRFKLQEKMRKGNVKMKFQPSINPRSRKIVNEKKVLKDRTNDDRYREYEETQKKLEQVRREVEAKRMKEFTFKPKINRKKRPTRDRDDLRKKNYDFYTVGTTGMKDPDVYMKRIRAQERRKKWRARKSKKEEMKKELEACTFKPRIKTLPSYMRKISRTYQKSKMDKKEEETKESWK